MKSFKDKVIVITGASAGVGRATAYAFARHGAKIALLARGIEALEATKKEVEKLGGTSIIIPTDVAFPEQVENAALQVEKAFGDLDIWINNAMNSVFSLFKDVTPEEFKRVNEVTYLGQVYGTMSALKRMLPRNKGKIILVGSALAYRGIPLQSAYCGAKHGIQGFYDSLRCELMIQKSSVEMCMVQLPAMNTTQFGWVLSRLPNKPKPMGKIYAPEVAAEGILYAASHHIKELFVGSPTYLAIVGNKIAPWYADKVLASDGLDGQQTNEPRSPDRVNNLWKPVEEDRGIYGSFGKEAHSSSWTLWLIKHGINPMVIFWILITGFLIALIILI